MSIFPSIAEAVNALNLLSSQAVVNTTPIESAWTDLAGYEGTLLLIFNSGVASASDTLTFTVLENTVNSGAGAAVPADALVNPATGANATPTVVTDGGAVFQVLALRRERLSRYLRVTATAAGSSISIPFSVALVAPRKYANAA